MDKERRERFKPEIEIVRDKIEFERVPINTPAEATQYFNDAARALGVATYNRGSKTFGSVRKGRGGIYTIHTIDFD